MAKTTGKKIAEAALTLFSEKGYLGTSMSDIAGVLGITKGALYKHYRSKKEIFSHILSRMSEEDTERATEYDMPLADPKEVASYRDTPAQKIRAYTLAQFDHWTKEPFAARFRRMLTVEQYRSPEMARLYEQYLAAGPLEYMRAVFCEFCDSDEEAGEAALAFYGPMHLLYSVYDGAEKKEKVADMLKTHIDVFIEAMERKKK